MPKIRAASIDEHKELTRRSLLDAAYRVIDEAGSAEVPLGEIALSAGVGRTTFYDYFDDRDDVIASLVEEGALGGAVVAVVGGTVVEVVVAGARVVGGAVAGGAVVGLLGGSQLAHHQSGG